jgi:hypothetical protein
MKEEKVKLELRMMGLVPYNISPIQQGIQYGHSKDEFTLKVIKSILNNDKSLSKDTVDDYLDWLENWKTYIILNGGTTNTNTNMLGTLNQHLETLKNNNVFCTEFYEPDLGNQLTGVTFLVDERVFDYKKYPNYEPGVVASINKWKFNREYKSWVESIGGEKNLFLREFLKQFRLA